MFGPVHVKAVPVPPDPPTVEKHCIALVKAIKNIEVLKI